MTAGEASTRQDIRSPFRHNAVVVRGFAAESPDGAGIDCAATVRLAALDGELSTAVTREVGLVGGGASGIADDGLAVSLSRVQFEALRARALTASNRVIHLVEEVGAALAAFHTEEFDLRCGDRALRCGRRPLVMGVVNCTADSFYAGSRTGGDDAVARALRMVEQGADILDIGGESTRPGSEPVDVETECARTLPVIEQLAAATDVPLSIDTTKAAVARRAVAAGASLINDISGLTYEPELAEVAAENGTALILMHMRGQPQSMYAEAEYGDAIADICGELRQSIAVAQAAGVDADQIVVDPGLGFAKRAEHSLEVLHRLAGMRSLGRPILVGPSRKSFIGAVLDLPPEERLEGTSAAVVAAVLAGAHMVRVHDVGSMRRAADMAAAIRSEGAGWIS